MKEYSLTNETVFILGLSLAIAGLFLFSLYGAYKITQPYIEFTGESTTLSVDNPIQDFEAAAAPVQTAIASPINLIPEASTISIAESLQVYENAAQKLDNTLTDSRLLISKLKDLNIKLLHDGSRSTAFTETRYDLLTTTNISGEIQHLIREMDYNTDFLRNDWYLCTRSAQSAADRGLSYIDRVAQYTPHRVLEDTLLHTYDSMGSMLKLTCRLINNDLILMQMNQRLAYLVNILNNHTSIIPLTNPRMLNTSLDALGDIAFVSLSSHKISRIFTIVNQILEYMA